MEDNLKYIEFKNDNKEQLLEDIKYEFPLISFLVDLDMYRGKMVPWHWHGEVEIFYVESGEVVYYTPNGVVKFPKGTAGFINSNVLHKTRANGGSEETDQMIHIFDPIIISGRQGTDIDRKYVTPLSSSSIDIVELSPYKDEERLIIDKIKDSFKIEKGEFYEVKIRCCLSEIWCDIFKITEKKMITSSKKDKVSERIKGMMVYIHNHYSEKISVSDIAANFYISERNCYRIFKDSLNMTPQEYIKNYRIQKSCELLAKSNTCIGDIGYMCGLGSNSYFGKVFKKEMKCTPAEFRDLWQNIDKNGQK